VGVVEWMVGSEVGASFRLGALVKVVFELEP
jgi:hypothetical protein